MLIVFVVANAVMMIVASHILSATRETEQKSQPYESGMPPLGDAHERFSVKFYMVAVLFILFDIETVFMIPWGAHFRQLSCEEGLNDTPDSAAWLSSPIAGLPSSTRR